MDPVTAVAIGLTIAKEVVQIVQDNKAIDETTLAIKISTLLLKIQSIQDTIKADMAQYGGQK